MQKSKVAAALERLRKGGRDDSSDEDNRGFRGGCAAGANLQDEFEREEDEASSNDGRSDGEDGIELDDREAPRMPQRPAGQLGLRESLAKAHVVVKKTRRIVPANEVLAAFEAAFEDSDDERPSTSRSGGTRSPTAGAHVGGDRLSTVSAPGPRLFATSAPGKAIDKAPAMVEADEGHGIAGNSSFRAVAAARGTSPDKTFAAPAPQISVEEQPGIDPPGASANLLPRDCIKRANLKVRFEDASTFRREASEGHEKSDGEKSVKDIGGCPAGRKRSAPTTGLKAAGEPPEDKRPKTAAREGGGVKPEDSASNYVKRAPNSHDADFGSAVLFYVISIHEDATSTRLYLFGKALCAAGTPWSACVTVLNLTRTVFALPVKQPAPLPPDVHPMDSDEWNEAAAACFGEIGAHLEKMRVTRATAKPVRRNICFSGEKREADQFCLKVSYPAESTPGNSTTLWESFNDLSPAAVDAHDSRGTAPPVQRRVRRVLNAGVGLMEQFILKRKLTFPCWLRLTNVQRNPTFNRVAGPNVVEMYITSPKDCTPLFAPGTEDDAKTTAPEPPELTLVAVSFQCALYAAGAVGICAIAAVSRLESKPSSGAATEKCSDRDTSSTVDVNGDDLRRRCSPQSGASSTLSSDNSNFLDSFLGVVAAGEFGNRARAAAASAGFQVYDSEKKMLGAFADAISAMDPDIVCGPDLSASALDLLVQRLEANKVSNWDKLSRFKAAAGARVGQLNKLRFESGQRTTLAQKLLFGRLLLDTTLLCRETLPSRASYTLQSVAADIFQAENSVPRDISVDQVLQTHCQDAAGLERLAQNCSSKAAWQFLLVDRLQMLALTRELAQLCGCPWSWTLLARRSDRNALLLLHSFWRRKFVVPEITAKHSRVTQSSARKKAAYEGGLVLDPQPGLYDTFVLLLDFNSLYPSIIQEYNVCFSTTLISTEGTVSANEISTTGILPEILRSLVEKRRKVKQQLKIATNATGCQAHAHTKDREALKVKEKALKLVANSIYGCLGYEGSRFCAQPLAAYVTSKGRELLLLTKQRIEEKFHLSVIYGDTDSVMVDTKLPADGESRFTASACHDEARRDAQQDKSSRNYKQAVEIGANIKNLVNRPESQLELSLDGVFCRLLLLMKKKYAAVKVVDYEKQEFLVENRGIELVRRDWCKLSRDAGVSVLNLMFARGETPEKIVGEVHDFLHALKEKLEDAAAGGTKIPADAFSITKSITKRLDQYTDEQPHVEVARKMQAAGQCVGVGQEIPYIIVAQAPLKEGRKIGLVQRAVSLDEVHRNNTLRPDVEWYKRTQIFPLINRLCKFLPGTSPQRLADCLDVTLQHGKTAAAVSEAAVDYEEDHPPDAEIDEVDNSIISSEVFLQTMSLRCPSCAEIVSAKNTLKALKCPACTKDFPLALFCNWLRRAWHYVVFATFTAKHECNECTSTGSAEGAKQNYTRFSGARGRFVSILAPRFCLRAGCGMPESAVRFPIRMTAPEAFAAHVLALLRGVIDKAGGKEDAPSSLHRCLVSSLRQMRCTRVDVEPFIRSTLINT